ncbi:MAG: hypothetical protein IJE46_02265 [Clostridia bacterium]|nr:hypothetical protein [Clostridia bacterium]
MEKGLFGASAFTSGRILPIQGVQVYVSSLQNGTETLLYSLLTDENGNTPIVELDAPDMALSESPGNYRPFSVYNVRAIKDGFFRTLIKDVQVFAKRTTIQNIDMIPLPKNTDGIDTTNTFIVLPQNL